MIPMIERTLPMLDLAERQAADPAVGRLAASFATAHRAELARLAELRRTAGFPTSMSMKVMTCQAW